MISRQRRACAHLVSRFWTVLYGEVEVSPDFRRRLVESPDGLADEDGDTESDFLRLPQSASFRLGLLESGVASEGTGGIR
jgi:hypothetical protein